MVAGDFALKTKNKNKTKQNKKKKQHSQQNHQTKPNKKTHLTKPFFHISSETKYFFFNLA